MEIVNYKIDKEAIQNYISENNYSWTVTAILAEFKKYQEGEYIPPTAKKIILNTILK